MSFRIAPIALLVCAFAGGCALDAEPRTPPPPPPPPPIDYESAPDDPAPSPIDASDTSVREAR